MTDSLRHDLAALMRAARADLDMGHDWNQLSDVGMIVDDYLAARAKLAALGEAARNLRLPPPPPLRQPLDQPPANGRLPHQNGATDSFNPALREALVRRGD